MALHRRFFRGREIDKALRFVDSVHVADFPLALGELGKFLAREIVEIQMAVAGAFTRPQEALSVFQEVEVIAEIDPVRVLFGEQPRGVSRSRVCEKQVENSLIAIESLNGKAPRIRQPIHTRNIDIRVAAYIHRASLAAAKRDLEHANCW